LRDITREHGEPNLVFGVILNQNYSP